MSLNETPRGSRLHIGIYGKRNSGKSSLINALTGQDIALVSPEAGTTTDPVFKSMELHPIGPVVFIDTAGFDDDGPLGELRVQRTQEVVEKTDVAILVVDGLYAKGALADMPQACGTSECSGSASADVFAYEKRWIDELAAKDVPVIIVVNKVESEQSDIELLQNIGNALPGYPVIAVSAAEKTGLEELRKVIENSVPEDFLREKILGDLVEDGGLVMLVMPQDIQAPKGRLILPQVQTLRELLDKKCISVATTADGFEKALAALNKAPDLIITDSQCFNMVYEKKPEGSALTSFSVLFAAYKGDINVFLEGTSALADMTENSRVLIAEACTHVPLTEDIGRVKIPALLRKRFGDGIEIVNVCGNDFPGHEELKKFELIIHCGACMFNRKHVLNRIATAEAAGVPITNYGIVLAELAGILDKIEIPD